MRFIYTVEVEVERIEGKFASRDEIGTEIEEALQSAEVTSFYCENGGQYETTSWEVSVGEER